MYNFPYNHGDGQNPGAPPSQQHHHGQPPPGSEHPQSNPGPYYPPPPLQNQGAFYLQQQYGGAMGPPTQGGSYAPPQRPSSQQPQAYRQVPAPRNDTFNPSNIDPALLGVQGGFQGQQQQQRPPNHQQHPTATGAGPATSNPHQQMHWQAPGQPGSQHPQPAPPQGQADQRFKEEISGLLKEYFAQQTQHMGMAPQQRQAPPSSAGGVSHVPVHLQRRPTGPPATINPAAAGPPASINPALLQQRNPNAGGEQSGMGVLVPQWGATAAMGADDIFAGFGGAPVGFPASGALQGGLFPVSASMNTRAPPSGQRPGQQPGAQAGASRPPPQPVPVPETINIIVYVPKCNVFRWSKTEALRTILPSLFSSAQVLHPKASAIRFQKRGLMNGLAFSVHRGELDQKLATLVDPAMKRVIDGKLGLASHSPQHTTVCTKGEIDRHIEMVYVQELSDLVAARMTPLLGWLQSEETRLAAYGWFDGEHRGKTLAEINQLQEDRKRFVEHNSAPITSWGA